jgi:hypothetical protein
MRTMRVVRRGAGGRQDRENRRVTMIYKYRAAL